MGSCLSSSYVETIDEPAVVHIICPRCHRTLEIPIASTVFRCPNPCNLLLTHTSLVSSSVGRAQTLSDINSTNERHRRGRRRRQSGENSNTDESLNSTNEIRSRVTHASTEELLNDPVVRSSREIQRLESERRLQAILDSIPHDSHQFYLMNELLLQLTRNLQRNRLRMMANDDANNDRPSADEDLPLPPRLVSMLPQYLYAPSSEMRPSTKGSEKALSLTINNPIECVICLQPYENGELLKTLPCLHVFHSACIDDWFSHRSTCPVDRLGVQKMMAMNNDGNGRSDDE
jgi:Ring finger domain